MIFVVYIVLTFNVTTLVQKDNLMFGTIKCVPPICSFAEILVPLMKRIFTVTHKNL